MNCPECDKEIPFFNQEYDFCEECGVYLHYCGDFGWKEVPVLDPITSTLTSWNGTGHNFLDEIRNSPTSNFLLTRKKIAWLITNSENHSRSATKDRWMSYNFKRYGLDFRPIDDYGKYSDERKGDWWDILMNRSKENLSKLANNQSKFITFNEILEEIKR